LTILGTGKLNISPVIILAKLVPRSHGTAQKVKPMNKLLLLTVVCALLVSTVGATATVSATQLGHTPIYYFDVTYNGKAIGHVVVNTANAKTPTYALAVYGLTPNTKYTFGYTVAGDVHMLGSADTTKAGALVMYGTFPAADVKNLQSAQFWVTETPLGSGYTQISGLGIANGGWFVAKMAIDYSTDGGVTWKRTFYSNGMTMGEDSWWTLDGFGVPAGALVKIHVDVVGGISGASGKTGSEVFQYVPWNPSVIDYYAQYTITGSIFKNKLQYNGLDRC
jgi:hypothetical protein